MTIECDTEGTFLGCCTCGDRQCGGTPKGYVRPKPSLDRFTFGLVNGKRRSFRAPVPSPEETPRDYGCDGDD